MNAGISLYAVVLLIGLVCITYQGVMGQTQDDASSHVLLPDFMVEIKKHNVEREESKKVDIARKKYRRIFKVHASEATRNFHDLRTNFDYEPGNIFNLPSEDQAVDKAPTPNKTEASYTPNMYSSKWAEIFNSLDDQVDKKWTRDNKLRFIRKFGHESEQTEKKKFYTERFVRTFGEFVRKSTDVQTSLRSTRSMHFRNAFRRQNEEESKKGNRRNIRIALIDKMKRSLLDEIDQMLDHVEVLPLPHPESIVRGMLDNPDEFDLSENESEKLEENMKTIKNKTLTIDPQVYQMHHHVIYDDFPLRYDNYSHFMDHRERFFALHAQDASSSAKQSRFRRTFSRILRGQGNRQTCRGGCKYSPGAAKAKLPDGSINYEAFLYHGKKPLKSLKDTSRGCNKGILDNMKKSYNTGAKTVGMTAKGTACPDLLANPTGVHSSRLEYCKTLKKGIDQWNIDCEKLKDLDHAANLERCLYPSIDALGPKGGNGWKPEQSIGWELMHTRHAHRAVCPVIFKPMLVDENGRWEASRTCSEQMCEFCLKKVMKCSSMSIAEGVKMFKQIYQNYISLFMQGQTSKAYRGEPIFSSNMPAQAMDWMKKSENQFNKYWKDFSNGQGSALCETMKHVMCTHVMKVCPLVSFLIAQYAFTSSFSNLVANYDPTYEGGFHGDKHEKKRRGEIPGGMLQRNIQSCFKKDIREIAKG